MTFKVVMTTAMGATKWEVETLGAVGAQLENVICKTEEDVLAVCRDADAVLAGPLEPYTRRVIENLEKCRVIARYGVGFDNVDVQAATDHGICVAYVPDASIDEVSDHAMALLLACARKLVPLDAGVKAGKWVFGNPELPRKRPPMFKLRGQTLGIIGCGRIGSALVPKAKGFGLRVLVCDPYLSPATGQTLGVELVDLDRLLAESDFVSINAPSNAETRRLIGRAQLAKMKKTACLINTARGPLVDEKALYDALSTGVIASAGIDVTDPEPPATDNPLFSLENIIVTAHSAFYSETATVILRQRPVEDVVRALLGGLPQSLVNPEVAPKLTWLKK